MHWGQVLVLRDFPGRLDSPQIRHPDVHQQDVRPGSGGQADRLPAVGGLADDLDVILGGQQRGEPTPDQFLVISQRDPDHRALRWLCSPGLADSRAWTRTAARAGR